MIRWYLDLAIVGRVVVGKVDQLPTSEAAGVGQVKPVGRWHAVGMENDWCDTELGSDFATRKLAMSAVAEWHAKRI